MSNNKIKPSLRKILFCCLALGAVLLAGAWSRPSGIGGKGRFVLRINDTIVKTAYQQMIDSLFELNLSPDSLKKMGLSDAVLFSLDSLRKADSIAQIKVYTPKELRKMKRDSIRKHTDSIIRNTPRILDTYLFADSIKYTRIFSWKHDTYFNNQEVLKIDTTFNYHFHDLPFHRDDINAQYLGVSGSAALPFNYHNRQTNELFPFFSPYMTYTYMPETLPFYNTKTPYTELAYYGTLFANRQKSEDNIKFLHTQNFTPSFNFTILYQRNGGGGLLQHEKTDFRTFSVTGNYLGKNYIAQGGYLYSRLKREENGGVEDLKMVSDTTIDVRTVPVYLSNANSIIRRNTFFITHSYGVPIRWKAQRDSLGNKIADTLSTGEGTATYFGHYGEYSVYSRSYTDNITDSVGRSLYRNIFLLNPTTTADSARVMNLENRVFLKIQPWNAESVVSNLDGGIGHQMLNFYGFKPEFFISGNQNKTYNNIYAYFGAGGKFRKYFAWNARAKADVAGYYKGNFSLDAAMRFSSWAVKDGIHLTAKFSSSIRKPSYFLNNYTSNHHLFDFDFDKTTTTRIEGKLEIPHWGLEASVGYTLLNKNVYLDTLCIPTQNNDAMSILSAYIAKNIKVGPLHLDNRVLFQTSSKQEVVPLPKVAVNLRYYLEFYAVKNILNVQFGADMTYNTKYYAQAFDPALGMFYNQERYKIGNNPYIDVFVNLQWKRACIFVKCENVLQGTPNNEYYSTYRYIRPQRALKLGIWWPFYIR
ncbi:MAG: putative porin [Bacteroidales bacterium]|nr:putative porin [Bacteroidales bacterium]MBR6972894.1 putative porin [Bacteroidales bacterium]